MTIDSNMTNNDPSAVATTGREPAGGIENRSPRSRGSFVGLVHWCIAHRRIVVVAWFSVAVVISLVAGSVGRRWATNFTLPGTQSQQASNLLNREFTAQSVDPYTHRLP